MIPSLVPSQLEGLTQVEEMLIARALPIIYACLHYAWWATRLFRPLYQSATEYSRTSTFFAKIRQIIICDSCQDER